MEKTDTPWTTLKAWLTEAESDPMGFLSATLTTMSPDGYPSSRIVGIVVITTFFPACKSFPTQEYEEPGLTIVTNMKSRKSRDLEENPKAALFFYFNTKAQRVIRIEGSFFNPVRP